MEWKEIYDGYYISDNGEIKSYKHNKVNGKLMKQFISGKGYKYVHLRIDGNTTQHIVHRLVAKAFIPNIDDKPTVNHINGIKTDNRVDNLEWNTRSENTQHGYDTGLIKNSMRKYTEEEVREFRRFYNDNEITHIKMANMFGINRRTLSSILNKTRYKNI